MADDKQSFEFADDKISEVQKKILEPNVNRVEKRQEIFSQINVAETAKVTQNPDPSKPAPNPVADNQALKVNKDKTVIKSLRTFQGDVAEIIKNQNTSVLSIALAEKKKKQEKEKTTPVKNPETKKRVIVIATSIILIALGVGAVAGFYMIQKNKPVPVIQVESEKTIIGFNSTIKLSVDNANRDALIQSLNQKRGDATMASNEILYVSFVKSSADGKQNPVDTNTFFSTVETQAPGSLLRAFGSQFMFGFYKAEINEPFLLIKLDSFDNAWSGMLAWEKNMNEDIGGIFSRRVLAITDTTPPAGTTTQTTTQVKIVNFDLTSNTKFEDITIKNKDARVLRNTNGEIILLYSFLDKQTLLITSSEAVLEAMVGKLAANKLVH